MLSLIKQVFIVLLSFGSSLARVAKVFDRIKCIPLNDEQFMARPTIIDLSPVELKYDPFMISLNKCTKSSNVLMLKIIVPKETKR